MFAALAPLFPSALVRFCPSPLLPFSSSPPLPPHFCISRTRAGASLLEEALRRLWAGASFASWVLQVPRRASRAPSGWIRGGGGGGGGGSSQHAGQGNEVQTTGGSSRWKFSLGRAATRRNEGVSDGWGGPKSRPRDSFSPSQCGSWHFSPLVCSPSRRRCGPLLVDLGPSRLPLRCSFALVAPARRAFRDVSH